MKKERAGPEDAGRDGDESGHERCRRLESERERILRKQLSRPQEWSEDEEYK